MHRVKPLVSRRLALLLAASVLLAFALALPAPRAAGALSCGIGCFSGGGIIYYTDASRRTELCRTDCNFDTCNGQTSRWFRPYRTCCCA
jgi:hypothetical protein